MAENIVLKIDVQNANSVGEASKQVGNIKKELRDLTKLLASGQLTADQFEEISKRAGELKDQIGDVNERVKNLASDSKTLDGYVGIATGITAGFSAVQGSMALFGDESENVQKALLKVQGATAMLSGFQEIQNALQNQSNFMMGITDLRTKALSVSTRLYAFATGGATASTNAFRIAMIGLTTAGIGIALVVLGKYVEQMNRQREAEDKRMESLKEYNDELIQNTAQSNVQISKLEQYQSVLNDGNATLTEKKGVYKELQTLIPSLTDYTYEQATATDVLNKAIQNEIALIGLRAKATALENYVVKEEEKKLAQQQLLDAQKVANNLNKINKLKADGNIVTEIATKNVEKSLTPLEQLAKVNQDIIDLQSKQNTIASDGAKIKQDQTDADAKAKKDEAERQAEKIRLEQMALKQKEYDAQSESEFIERVTNESIEADNQIAISKANTLGYQIEVFQKYRDKHKELTAEELAEKKAIADAEHELLNTKMNALQTGFDIAQQFTGKNKALSDTLFAIQKGVAIAQIIVDTQKEISGYASNPLWTAMPDGGASLKIPAIASAKIRAVTSIATIGATTIGKFMNGGGGGAGGGGGNSGGSSAPSLRAYQTNLPEQQGGGSSNAMKVYVTETDIRKTTNKTNSIYSQAMVD
jgi:hypothetical protein